MEAMFKVSVPCGYNIIWDDFLEFLREVVPNYNDNIKLSVSGPILSVEKQSEVFADVYSLLNCMPDYYIRFGQVDNKTYCSLIPFEPTQTDNGAIGVASCHEDDDFSYEYGCILAFARALGDEDLESRILMCDPQAAEEYFENTAFYSFF